MLSRLLPLTLCAALAFAAPKPPPPQGVPVKIEGREILRLWGPTPPFTLEERAAQVESRIESIAQRSRAERIPITTVETGLGIVLLTQNAHILVITEADAAGAGVPRAELAARYAAAIQDAVFGYKQSHTFLAYVFSIAKALAAWAVFALFCWLAVRGFRAAGASIRSRFKRRSAATGSRGVTLLLWEKATIFALILLRILAGIFLLFQFSFVISFTLGLFPGTAHISTTFLDYLKNTFTAIGLAFLDYLPSGGFVVIVSILTHYLLRFLKLISVAAERGDITVPIFSAETARPTYQLLRIGVIIFAVVVAYPYLPGGQSEAFKGVSLFLGVLISLSSGSIVANLFAGIVLTYMRPYKLGDRILVSGTLGAVIHKNLLVTRIRTFKNEEVIIPNSAILGGQILNYSSFAKEEGFTLNTTVTIGYDAPWRKVHEIMLEAARRTDGVKQSPEPYILQKSLNDFHVSYQLNAFSDRPEEWEKLYSRLHQNIQDCFNEAGVEIMSPTFFGIRDGNTVTTPADYRPSGYVAPAFRIEE